MMSGLRSFKHADKMHRRYHYRKLHDFQGNAEVQGAYVSAGTTGGK